MVHYYREMILYKIKSSSKKKPQKKPERGYWLEFTGPRPAGKREKGTGISEPNWVGI